ncbi:hypothetical protein BpHYR1_016031 [Brachionus plicatilis]|uniref:Uncharacterized protein n=1 Tax=Brachionus plicatilis TaxID=10195 RepID=A0A3M7RGS6_BRAPC|nr:hypothetical protein BpHYR1_016031 [Brachionus plicatilis]
MLELKFLKEESLGKEPASVREKEIFQEENLSSNDAKYSVAPALHVLGLELFLQGLNVVLDALDQLSLVVVKRENIRNIFSSFLALLSWSRSLAITTLSMRSS